VPFPVEVKINVRIRIKIRIKIRIRIRIRIKINVKGVGQECPTHTGKGKVGGEINLKGLLRRDRKSRPFNAAENRVFPQPRSKGS
jgi:hypothetical protein